VRALVLALAAILAAGGSGCGRSQAEARTVRLAVWSMWAGEEERVFKRVLARYMELNPHVRIENLGAVRDDTKTVRAIVAGVPPDLFTVADPLYVGPLAANGAVYALDEWFHASGLREEEFLPAALNQCRYQGRLHAMPFLVDCYALMWNKRLFREAGLDPERPPETLEELEAFALKLTRFDRSGNLIRLGFQPVSNRSFYAGEIFMLFHLFGGRLYDPASGRVTPDEPRNVAAMEWFKRLVDRMGGYRRVNAFAAGFGQPQGGNNPFLMGKIAMMINGQWNPYWAHEYKPGLEYGVAPIPAPRNRPDRRGTTWFGGNLFCIPKGSRNPEEAWKLLAWMQTPEAQYLFADTMHGVPNVRAAMRDPRLRTGESWRPLYGRFIDLALSPTAGHFPVLPVSGLYYTQLLDSLDMVLDGQKTPRQALGDVGVRVQRELDRYGEGHGG